MRIENMTLQNERGKTVCWKENSTTKQDSENEKVVIALEFVNLFNLVSLWSGVEWNFRNYLGRKETDYAVMPQHTLSYPSVSW